jgi:hypothetical protein
MMQQMKGYANSTPIVVCILVRVYDVDSTVSNGEGNETYAFIMVFLVDQWEY